MRRLGLGGGLLLLVTAAGCFRTNIQSGVPVGPASAIAEGVSHHAVIAGAVELSVPGDLEGACPQRGWAAISESVAPLQVVLQVITFGIYTPRTYTISCAAQGGDPASATPGPPAGYVPTTP